MIWLAAASLFYSSTYLPLLSAILQIAHDSRSGVFKRGEIVWEIGVRLSKSAKFVSKLTKSFVACDFCAAI